MKLTASQRQTEGDEDVQSNTITQLEIDAIMLEAIALGLVNYSMTDARPLLTPREAHAKTYCYERRFKL
ncbi:unnamed protein product [Arabidopsis halleri]